MAERLRLEAASGGSYFSQPKTDIEFVNTGCKPLDLVLGGGWARRRISNIVGDKSSGKTLLCIEASANFLQQYPKGKIRYRETEAAFLPDYAKALGMPVEKVDFGNGMTETVEDLFEDMEAVIKAAQKHKQPELYIVDSLDALTDRAEQKRKIDQGSFGANKAKQLSRLFRELVRQMERTDVTMMIVSQVRDKIGVTFGRKTTRAGGRALDFYASQVIYLAQMGKIVKEVEKIKRPVGVKVKALCDKNKIGLPFRQCEFNLLFGYGIDDKKACQVWLSEHGVKVVNGAKLAELHQDVEKRWFEVEQSFLPKRKKYGG